MTGGVQGVAAFRENPARAGVRLAKGEEVGGDVGLLFRESLGGVRKLIHEGESEIMFFGGKVHLEKAAREFCGGFPADLAAKTGFVTSSFDRSQVAQEIEENGFDEVPIFGAAGKKGAEPEFVAFGFVDVDGGEIALAGSGNIETEAEFADWSVLK